MAEDTEYFQYLKGRSLTSYLYRRWWLYPRISRQLHGRVLDVGCGIGDFLAFRPGAEGVDINPLTVAWCRRRGLTATEMVPDQLPYADGTFGGVVLDNVLEHLSRPAALLAEIHRVLGPAGRLVVGVPGEVGYARDPDHKVFYDERALRRTLTDAGFDPIRVLHMPIRSAWLAPRMPQYCLYGVFARRAIGGPA